MNIAAILSFVQLAIAAAPSAEKLVVEGKKVIQDLFENKLIDVATQQKYMDWADAAQAAALAGERPPEFQVE